MLSLFPAIRLTHGQHVDLDWPAFAAQYLQKHDIRARKDGRLFSFAVYYTDPERGDGNVRAMTGIVMDFDNSEGLGNDAHCTSTPTLPGDHEENLGDLTYAYYSTHSNRAEWPKWRLALPLDRDVLPHEWPAVWDGAHALLARDSNIDPSCKDLSRAYYTPSCPAELMGQAFTAFQPGRICSVDELLKLSTVSIGTNVHQLPGSERARSTGRNDALRTVAAAMLGRSAPIEQVVIELLKVDSAHNPPLFTDASEGYRGTPEAGALKFAANIAYSQSARAVRSGMQPDGLGLRDLNDVHGFAPPAPGESLIILARDLPDAVAEIDWLVDDYFEAGALSVLFGEPGAGKSFLAIDIALSIAAGYPWHGNGVRQTPVLYVCGEGHTGLHRRMQAWREWHQIDYHTLPFAMTRRAVPLINVRAIQILKDDIDRAVDALGDVPGWFCVDTLARAMGGADENSTKDMMMLIDNVGLYLMSTYKAAVLLVHHTGHGDKTRARGSSSLKGAVDSEYFVAKNEAGMIELSGLKMKDAPLPSTLHFGLRHVDIGGLDRRGKQISSVLPLRMAPAAGSELHKPQTGKGFKQEGLYDLLASLYADARQNLEAAGRAPSEARIDLKFLRETAFDRGLFDGQYRRQRFNDTVKSLEDAGLVFLNRPFIVPRDSF